MTCFRERNERTKERNVVVIETNVKEMEMNEQICWMFTYWKYVETVPTLNEKE